MTFGIMTASYIGASALFILALGGLSHQESARRGNIYGILGMALAMVVTIAGAVNDNYLLLGLGLIPGAIDRLRISETRGNDFHAGVGSDTTQLSRFGCCICWFC